jgi:hypothetical protein
MADLRKDGEQWAVILVGELCHTRGKVRQALNDAPHLREWTPFEAEGSLGRLGTVKQSMVKLARMGVPATHTFPHRVEDHLNGSFYA